MSDSDHHFITSGGVAVTRSAAQIAFDGAIDRWVERLDAERGAVFTSSYEYPGRYTRWEFALVGPPLTVESRGREVRITALNARGEVLLGSIAAALDSAPEIAALERSPTRIDVTVARPERAFSEEARSRQPSVFSVLRRIGDLFGSDEDGNLGLAGAFGYDLAFQFDPIALRLERPERQRDMVLYLPDEILVVDHYARRATVFGYEFAHGGASTEGIERTARPEPFRRADREPGRGDHAPGEYAEVVRTAFPHFTRGDLFEVVPGQVFTRRLDAPPSALHRRLSELNPSPYGFFINLGAQEYVVGASPEMFVRVNGRRVETCPISGTIARGRDAIEDEEQIRKLLNSQKDMTELTMCSDVDRNDKSRVCVPGSVRVIGRRQIEMYSRLIHTVDHIEGMLLDDRDALDAFLSHAWAVTVTGAPKRRAMEFIEAHERSPRAWYGGAVGLLHFNGDLNTGLTLRTVRIADGIAEVRAGATLLADSDPEEEERETELKASAMLAAIETAGAAGRAEAKRAAAPAAAGHRALLVDHEDSFVHTLASYLRQAGLAVTTLRSPISAADIARISPDIVVMSPGPGTPVDFGCSETIRLARAASLPVFGVCLGLQAIVEAYGGRLLYDTPMHGKASEVTLAPDSRLFAGLGPKITVGRYHSIVADPEAMPAELAVTATTDDGRIMAVEHVREPVAAVQFHPESIMTLGGDAGMRIVKNAVESLLSTQPHPPAEAVMAE